MLKRNARLWRLLCLFVWLAALAGHCQAVDASTPQAPKEDAPLDAKLISVAVSGTKRYRPEDVVAATGLHVGDTVTPEDIQAAADRLIQLGPFLSARYRFTSSGDDLRLEFQVADAPTVPVSFDNLPWFTDAEFTEALKQSVVLFDGTAPEQGSILDAMTETLQKLLPTRGIHGTVERTLMAQPDGDAMMQQFKVVGASLTIEAVQWGDALAAESKRVRERLSDLVGKPYSRFAVEVFAREQVWPAYLESGHLRVRIGKPGVRLTGDPNRPLPSSVLVIVPIDPGPVYRWGGIEWRGHGAFGPAALNEFVSVKPGEISDGMKIAQSWRRLQDEYGRRGYLDAQVARQPVFDDAAGRVSYRVNISEGSAYRMGELVITGLSPAAEQKLIQAWRIPKGQTFDRVYFDDFLATGIKHAFADTAVHYDEVGHWLRANPETRTVDVLLDFK